MKVPEPIDIPSPPSGEGGRKPPSITARNFCDRFGYSQQLISDKIRQGVLTPIGTGSKNNSPTRLFNEFHIIHMALINEQRKTPKKCKWDKLWARFNELIEGGYTIDGTVSDAPPTSPGQFFLEDQLAALQDVHIPDEIRDSARGISEVGKAMAEAISANERQVRLLLEAGRLVHVDEIEVLIRSTLEDWVAEVRDLPLSIDAKVAAETDLPIADCRRLLELVRDYLLNYAGGVIEKVSTETQQYVTMHQPKRRAVGK